ncbi:hypothetical protein M427DRAFT_461628 [Gonapodya prolifera JEL478]|uniref:L domain-like protein n=1 Tax=Gonapodya prolifera (strain JEL478) TaxID=1344416 RepID=A0A139A328_GONPJ|nr:hypothetical protein M427DRAFT_461628 [Gonapodya prolifera JEL478]|eukprot:KXS10783.1 hypothetical protein M427DRAFT_461628 [Gonapodya prolifera JEL478]
MRTFVWHNILTSPNANPPIDGMFPHIIHEIAEAATNPKILPNKTDQCDYTYGDAKEERGYWYNAEWNGRKYLIPQHWNPTLQQQCEPGLKPPISDCKKLQSLLPNFYLGDDCCNSGYAYCANSVIRNLEIHTGNDTQGHLQTFLEKISDLFPELEILQIASMPLTGELTDAICCLKKLQWISIYSVYNITGTLPECLGNLRNLSLLEIHDNANFGGPIPKSLSKMTLLRTLRLGNNNLSGAIPDFSQLELLSSAKQRKLERIALLRISSAPWTKQHSRSVKWTATQVVRSWRDRYMSTKQLYRPDVFLRQEVLIYL